MSYVNDPISDMLTRIRNAQLVDKKTVAIPHSNLKEDIARILEDEGYIEGYEVSGEATHKNVVITLKYVGRRRDVRPVITGMERVSKPGRRKYASVDEIPWVLSGMGVAIMTTPKGVMTGQTARREHVGGEIMCYVW